MWIAIFLPENWDQDSLTWFSFFQRQKKLHVSYVMITGITVYHGINTHTVERYELPFSPTVSSHFFFFFLIDDWQITLTWCFLWQQICPNMPLPPPVAAAVPCPVRAGCYCAPLFSNLTLNSDLNLSQQTWWLFWLWKYQQRQFWWVVFGFRPVWIKCVLAH